MRFARTAVLLGVGLLWFGLGPVVPLPEPVVVVGEPAPSGAPATGGGDGRVRAGVLTAGDIDDALNLPGFAAFLETARAGTGLPVLDFGGVRPSTSVTTAARASAIRAFSSWRTSVPSVIASASPMATGVLPERADFAIEEVPSEVART